MLDKPVCMAEAFKLHKIQHFDMEKRPDTIAMRACDM